MKLIRLKILQNGGFRSLPQGFEIRFLNDFNMGEATDFNPYVLAGRNGSGKSNILEALAEIFYHLDCIYLENKPDYFVDDEEDENDRNKGFDPKKSRVDAYELEYFTLPDSKVFININDTSKLAKIRITKKENERPIVEWLNQSDFREESSLTQKETKSLLPQYVIGYASGDNEILSLPFFKSRFLQFDAYINTLKNQQFEDPSPESSLVFLDSSLSQAILLTNLLMWEDKNVLKPFKKYIGLTYVDTFRLIIRTDVRVDNDFDLLHNLDLEDTKQNSPFTRSYINKLKKCATAWYEYTEEDYMVTESGDFLVTETEERLIAESENSREYLILDYKVNEETKKAFRFHFENNPLKLFELLQLLFILDIHTISKSRKENVYSTENIFINQDINTRPEEENRILRIKDFTIKKEGVPTGIYTKALSDGEHQFLHALGLSLLFKDTKSLFLLDEPETHFNPDWKAKFISSIRNAFNKEEKESKQTIREMLVTTHSPFLISDSTSDYVLVFKKDEQVKRPVFQTFGTSINKIGIRIFEMPNTVGEYAQERIKYFENEINQLSNKNNGNDLIEKVTAELGDSVETTILLHKISEKIKEFE